MSEEAQQLKIWMHKESTVDSISKVMPVDYRLETMILMATSAMWDNKKLMAAFKTQIGKMSLLTSMVYLARFGLVPDGQFAYLIPYKGIVKPMIDYKGWIQLIYQDGGKAVDGAVVYQLHDKDGVLMDGGDEFSVDMASNTIIHKPAFPRIGKPVAVWTRVVMEDGTVHIHPMQLDDVESKRKRSKFFNSGPNQTDPDDMRLRTCLKNHLKWLPIGKSLEALIKQDSDAPLDETKLGTKEPGVEVAKGGGLVIEIEGEEVEEEPVKVLPLLATVLARCEQVGLAIPELEWYLNEQDVLADGEKLSDLAQPALLGSMDVIEKNISKYEKEKAEKTEKPKKTNDEIWEANEKAEQDAQEQKQEMKEQGQDQEGDLLL